MTVILIILGIFVYLLIGGVIGYLIDVNDDDFSLLCVFFWPIMVALLIIVGTGIGMTKLGVFISEYIIEALTPVCEQIDNWLNKKGEDQHDQDN